MFFKKRVKWYKVFSTEKEAEEKVAINKGVAVDIEGNQICLIHASDGFYAIENRCPHQQAPLHQGTCAEDDFFVCPFHRLRIHMKSGKVEKDTYEAIKTYEVKISKDGLFIGIK